MHNQAHGEMMTTTALEVNVSAVGAVGKDTDSASAPM
jgi:hypothetical protein